MHLLNWNTMTMKTEHQHREAVLLQSREPFVKANTITLPAVLWGGGSCSDRSRLFIHVSMVTDGIKNVYSFHFRHLLH